MNLEETKALEQFKADLISAQAQRRVAAEISMLALRSLILVSGGALIGLLTFVGNVWVRDPSSGRETASGMLWAVICFAIALSSSIGAAIAGYLSSLRFARSLGPPIRKRLAVRAGYTRSWAMGLALFCAVMIVLGFVAAIWALRGSLHGSPLSIG